MVTKLNINIILSVLNFLFVVMRISPETVKSELRVYSKFLRRDFLVILVKMSSKYFGIKTVRTDWRTRKGMLAFLSQCWERLNPLFHQESIFKWYAESFNSLEKVLGNKKFVLYIFSNWDTYSKLLTDNEILQLIRNNQTEFEALLTNPSFDTDVFHKFDDVGKSVLNLFRDFLSNVDFKKTRNPLSADTHGKIDEPSLYDPSHANIEFHDTTSDHFLQPVDDILIEQTFSPAALEYDFDRSLRFEDLMMIDGSLNHDDFV